MTGIGGDHWTLNGEASGISQLILADDLTQLFNYSGEHRLRLMSLAPLREVPVTLRFIVPSA